MSTEDEIDHGENMPLTIAYSVQANGDGTFRLDLRVSSDAIADTVLKQTVPIEFDTEEDAETIGRRIIRYYRRHGVAPDFENPDFRNRDETIALAALPT